MLSARKFTAILAAMVLSNSLTVQASDFKEPELIRCTCYTASEGSITASGQHVREGIIAGKEEWLGCVAMLYDKDMNFIGFFEFKDTGNGMDTDGDGIGDTIRNGKSVDVYRDTLDGCYEWVGQYGDYVYMRIVKGEG